MNRTFRLAGLGGLAGLVTWLVSEPFARTAADHGVRVGSTSFSIGSFYGWFAHALLGATIVGFLALSVSLERTRPMRALLWGGVGFLLGGFLGWLSDCQADLLAIRLLRSGAMPSLGVTLFWHFAVSMSLALGLALCTQPTPARVGRVLAGGVAAALGSFMAKVGLAPFTAILALVQGGVGWRPYAPERLADHAVMGIILGLCVGLGESALTSARMRLVLGRNEGREFALGHGLNRIGAAEGIEVPLFGGSGIAPVHAQIWRQDGRWHLADAGAPGGTRVNGQPVAGCLLQGGETIEIGPFRLQFLLKNGPAVPAPLAYAPAAPLPASPPTREPAVALLPHRLVDPFGAVTDLLEGETTVGRDAAAKIRIGHDGLVSRLHARIVIHGVRATVEDLGSRNGTEVNGRRIQEPTALHDGDSVRVGSTTVTYRAGEG